MINILGFNLHKLNNYHTTFISSEKTHKEYILDDIIETHYIDLTQFRKNDITLNNLKDRLTLLLNEKTPQNLINKMIEMDEFTNNIYNKTSHILKDKQEYLSYIRAEKT